MFSLRIVLSCSIAPSLLIVGVVVEQGHQGIQYDYYEAKADKLVTEICPTDHPEWKAEGKHTKAAAQGTKENKDNTEIGRTFAQANFVPYLGNKQEHIEKALKKFLFETEAEHGIPKLFKNPTNGLKVGPKNECALAINWVVVDAADDMKYLCTDCGYAPTAPMIQTIVDFANSVNDDKKTKTGDVPPLWCHNPLPTVPYKMKSSVWRETGGYYNVLKCKTSQYSVIGFAGEKPDTCYPYHTHKSYELYWTIGGKADWMPAAHPFEKYTMNGADHWLHKHDPMVTHEIRTNINHTTQIYFWSMKDDDKVDVNNYNVDEAVFGNVMDMKTEQYAAQSCYHTMGDTAVAPK